MLPTPTTPPHAQPAQVDPALLTERVGSTGLAFLIGLVIAWFLQVV